MNPIFGKHFAALQSATDVLLKEVSSLSSSTYYFRPGEEKWSISQILTHLLTSEKLSLDYMKKKSMAPMSSIDEAGLLDDIRFFVLQLSQRLPLRYTAPKYVVVNTPQSLSFGELVRQWESVRNEMKSFLDSIDTPNIHKKIYKHPYAGRLSAVHAIRFQTEHIQHHLPQIIKIIKSRKKTVIKDQG